MVEQKGKDFKYLVRISNTDLTGDKPIYKALTKIKGVGYMFANMICTLAKVQKTKRTGDLSDEDIKQIEDTINNPTKYGAPEWMLNRRRDIEDNVSKHLVSANLTFTQDTDTKIMKKIKSYKGMRHIFGLPVRGQRTRSNFRKNKGRVSLGVKRRAGAKSGRS